MINSERSLERVDSILKNGKPPFDYGKILFKNYNSRLVSYFNCKNPIPYEIEIQPSSKCNAHCTHCWAKGFSKLEDKLETKENADIVVDKILNFNQKELSLPRIKFCGSTGDPLMNPIIDYIIERFYNQRNMRLFTNGIKIGENKDNKKYLYSLSKLDSIYLSLDSGTTETLWKIKNGAKKTKIKVEDILEGAKRIKEFGNTSIDVSYVITKENYSEIFEATRKAKEYEADLIRFRIDLRDREISKEKNKEIILNLDKAKKYRDEKFKVIPIHSNEEISETDSKFFGSRGQELKCYTNNFWTCVGPNGQVYPCGHIVSPETEDYGSLFEQTFEEIWNGEKIKEARSKIPGKLCEICSPFSLTTNIIMNDISSLEREDLFQFLKEYIDKNA
jgi:radical SAM protein with 4Fe4S-binding SPASM domain